jgi:S1-C subfamily serine protease
MRIFTLAAVTAALTLTTAVRADDTGYIGVQIKKTTDGFAVQEVFGPAAKAGIMKGDVIKKWNDDEIVLLPIEVFVKKVQASKPGDEIKFTILRDQKEKEIKVKVGKVGG